MGWTIVFSEEVGDWYAQLRNIKDLSQADAAFERLRNAGHMLGMPLSKNLGGGLYELRFTCEGVARRISYTLEPERQVITLTTFRKQKQNERAEILRARRRLQQRKD